MEIVGLPLLLLLLYAGFYGGQEIAREGRERWGAFKGRVRRTGHPVARAGVNTVAATGWVAATGGRGVASAVRKDRDLVRSRLSPEGRDQAARKRAEKQAHREAARRSRAQRVATKREQRASAYDRRTAAGPYADGPPIKDATHDPRDEVDATGRVQRPFGQGPFICRGLGEDRTHDLESDPDCLTCSVYRATRARQLETDWRASAAAGAGSPVGLTDDPDDEDEDDYMTDQERDEARWSAKTGKCCWVIQYDGWDGRRQLCGDRITPGYIYCPEHLEDIDDWGGRSRHDFLFHMQDVEPEDIAPGNDLPDDHPRKPPAVTSAGSTTTGGPMPATATGEAPTFETMTAQIGQLRQDAEEAAGIVNRIAEAAERLDASAASARLDQETRQSLNAIGAACAESAEQLGTIPAAAQRAGVTLHRQQGALHEAHMAQPNAANEEFLSEGASVAGQ